MVRRPVNPPTPGWSLTIPPSLWRQLSNLLFRADGSSHGAVLLAGQADGPRGPRLLARELIPAADGIEYAAGLHGHHALAADFVRDAIIRAREEKLAYLAVHAHGGLNRVGFSPVDLASHERGYPALRQISGQVVGALVLTTHAAAGDLWLPDGSRVPLVETVIPAGNLLRLRPSPSVSSSLDPEHDRQARLLGDLGQETLRQLRIGVVGLGGVGSILVEELARLGVGSLVLIDDETIDPSNLSRLIAAEQDDVGRPKTEAAARNARRAQSRIDLTLVPRRAEHPQARHELERCDWIFLAADGYAARHWVNAIAHQYLIPATQIGVKIPVTPEGTVGQIHTATRLLPPGEGCLWCNGLIDPVGLAIDMHPEDERRAAQYVPGVPAPSVIALNSLAVSEALSHFVLAAGGLNLEDDDSSSIIHRPRSRLRDLQDPRQSPECRWCTSAGQLGRGEPAFPPETNLPRASSKR